MIHMPTLSASTLALSLLWAGVALGQTPPTQSPDECNLLEPLEITLDPASRKITLKHPSCDTHLRRLTCQELSRYLTDTARDIEGMQSAYDRAVAEARDEFDIYGLGPLSMVPTREGPAYIQSWKDRLKSASEALSRASQDRDNRYACPLVG